MGAVHVIRSRSGDPLSAQSLLLLWKTWKFLCTFFRKMEDIHIERSKLIQRQKKEMAELEKDLKKKKGAMREAVQEKIEETEALHAEELAAFDKTHAVEKAKPVDSPATEVKHIAIQQRNWGKCSKAELEEECLERGLSKKGSKEELITRLMTCSAVVVKKEETEHSPTKDESDSDDSEDDSEEDSDEDSDDQAPVIVDDEEAAKQVKRERIVQKAILHLFEVRFPTGFKLEDLAANLAKIQVNNFKVQSLGYDSLHDFARKQPKDIIRYDKYKSMLYPAPKEGEKKGKKASSKQ